MQIGFQGEALAALEILDSFGQRSVLKFGKVEVNPSLPPATFQFKPPSGRRRGPAVASATPPDRRGRLFDGNLHAPPLAERLRPRTLGEVIGQQHLLGPGKPLRIAFESGQPHS